ncbi:hypothetical protein SD71_15125 [Cohnella kolymensis]|uniref:DNA-directed RNA polymerase subunit sigma n=1 Tax=Cohnella kolymensis TaxID=1590652 RepID=A0ABR5A1T9_9BACL|nr:RNA polymerase sigma factor [Cohnella kolymensis]KIL35010.1 hypothetical protein SD71_15125 [Cohnella kolymensis]
MDELIELCKKGDMAGFGMLFEKYGSTIHKTAYLITRNHQMAEDVTQETLIHLFSNIKYYRPEQPFENWLYRVTSNLTKNALRKENGLFGLNKKLMSFPGSNGEPKSPDLILVQKESQSELFSQIARLPYKIRIVVVLKYFNGQTQEQIANILSIPVGTVKWRIHQALTKLKRTADQESFFI